MIEMKGTGNNQMSVWQVTKAQILGVQSPARGPRNVILFVRTILVVPKAILKNDH